MAGIRGLAGHDGEKSNALERRASLRNLVSHAPAPKKAGLADGIEARLIYISRNRILFETAERLVPEGMAYVRLIAADAMFMLRGRILRSNPTLLGNANTVYESAVEFDGKTPMSVRAGGGCEAGEHEAPARSGIESGSGHAGVRPSGQTVQLLPTYMIHAAVPRTGPDLHQIFGLNAW